MKKQENGITIKAKAIKNGKEGITMNRQERRAAAKKEKGFKSETLKKVYKALDEKIAFYMGKNPEEIKICVSKGNIKIGHTLNVSLAPMITCPNCAGCCRFCYDIASCLQYKNVTDARARNTALFKLDRGLYFARVAEIMRRRRKDFYLRFHVSGDIVDTDHFSRMVEIAKQFPHYRIWTYTKNYWAVNEYVKTHGGNRETAIPSNFTVMFSEWEGMPMVNPYGFPVFCCAFREESKIGKMKCPGNCNACKRNGTGCIYGKSVYTDPHGPAAGVTSETLFDK